jgi:hypothetical protein
MTQYEQADDKDYGVEQRKVKNASFHIMILN